MKKIRSLAAILSAGAMALSSGAVTSYAESGDDEISASADIEQMISEMSLNQKIEQMIMITLHSWNDGKSFENVTSLNEELTNLIKDHNFCGVALYAENISSIAQTVALTNEIQQAALSSECGIPMLISADQEGGDIYRLTTGTTTCGNMALGAARDPQLAYENAQILGSEITALGINTDLAPVIDVNNNPLNAVINIRSFSSDPELVSQLGTAYINGLHSVGSIVTCKHFPGHGDTSVDSHTGLPLIDKSYEELKKEELYPYAAAIEAGTDMIMTTHIQYPQIEKNVYVSKLDDGFITLPATLSKTIITDILRGDMGYEGVVITDAMQMSAIRQHFDLIEAAVMALNADVDILLEPLYIQSSEDIEALENYIDYLAEKAENGNIPVETIDKSVARILTMKQERGILDYTPKDPAAASQTVGSAENREKALQIAERGVTLIKNDNDLLPLKLDDDAKVLYFYPYSNVENTMYFVLDRLKKEGIVPEGVTADCNCIQEHTAADFEENIKSCEAVIIDFEMYRAANIDSSNTRGWQAVFFDELVKLAHDNGKKVIAISGNQPYDIARITAADAVLACYSANPMEALPVDGQENTAYGVNYPAALITVFGGNSPTGKLPVDIPALDGNQQLTDKVLFPFGYGLEYAKEPEPEPEPVPGSSSQPESSESESSDDESSTPEQSSSSSADASSEAESSSAADKGSNPATGAMAFVFAPMLAAAAALASRKKK